MWFITKFRRRSESSVQQLRPIFQVTACVCASLRSVKMNWRKGQWDNWGLAFSVRLFDAAPQSQTPAYYTDARRTSKVAWSPTLLPSSAAPSTFGMGPPRGNYLRRYSPRHGPDGAQYRRRARKAPPLSAFLKASAAQPKVILRCLTKRAAKMTTRWWWWSLQFAAWHINCFCWRVYYGVEMAKNKRVCWRRRTNVRKNNGMLQVWSILRREYMGFCSANIFFWKIFSPFIY